MSDNSTFQDRASQAADAKQRALEQLKARPPVDEKLAAERAARAERKEAVKAEKVAAKKAEREAQAAAAAAATATAVVPKTEAELKAARDARYAARKNRR